MPRPIATALLVICAALWGFAFIAQKSAMESMGPLTFAGVRYLCAGLIVLPFALAEYRRRTRELTRADWLAVAGLCAAFFFGSWLQQAGLLTTTVTNGGFLTGLYVFFVPVVGWLLFRTLPHPVVWLAVPAALLGIYLLNGATLASFTLGDGLIIASAVFWGFHVTLLGHLARTTGLPIFVSVLSFLAAGILATAIAVPTEAPTLAGISAGWVELAYAAVMSTAIGFSLQALGQQYVPPANAGIILSSESLFAALGGALFLGERLLPIGYVGAALIFLAILTAEGLPPWLERRRQHVPRPVN